MLLGDGARLDDQTGRDRSERSTEYMSSFVRNLTNVALLEQCVCACMCVCVCVSVCMCGVCLSLSVCVSVCICICVCLSVCVYVSV